MAFLENGQQTKKRRKGGQEMLTMRNGLKEHSIADFWGLLDELKERARRRVNSETIARNALALAGAISICYVALRIIEGVRNYLAYAY